MAELSSNWKRLQEKIKAESASATQPKKRKAKDPIQPQARKKSSETLARQTAPPNQSTKATKPQPIQRKMGSVQRSLAAERAKSGVLPSAGLWAEDNKEVSAEHLAEAYDLGIKGAAGEGFADKVNQGLTAGLQIGKYIAMDCEMVGVGPGGHESVLARVSLVDFHGQQVYDSYVRPKEHVTDWRTPVSGISPKCMRFARDFEEVQREVLKILKDRVLVGHDIKHDLEALRSEHPPRDIRDTARHSSFKKYGNGRKPALKVLAREILGWEIQQGAHSSTEDARAAMILFRRHKPGFDVDHANRYGPAPAGGTRASRGKKTKKK
ncbi:RNA exonuclease 4 [Escovopsis weberi]|uniref:RNA exonuclease 4 n=1 Tax=Escovopsis weberi TaxID=150374 RepID=A0A0N0RTP7_ESCWE|nr:RNA exonuclease 4 [Escovopsis weberi]